MRTRWELIGFASCVALSAWLLPSSAIRHMAAPRASAQIPSDHWPGDTASARNAAKGSGKSTRSTFLSLPLSFEANHGQAGKGVQFLAHGNGYTLLLTDDGFEMALRKPELQRNSQIRDRNNTKFASRQTGVDGGRALRNNADLRVRLVGANRQASVQGREKLPGRTSYFIGSDPRKWSADIPTFSRVQFADVYPGVDLVYYGNQRQLEYDFVVAPGGKADKILLKIEGADEVAVDEQGDLRLLTSDNAVLLRKPNVYQLKKGTKQMVPAHYVISGKREVRFALGSYDRRLPLVLDPVVSYETFLGGDGDDFAHTIAVDAAGSVYLAGQTQSTNFPTKSPIQASLSGSLCGDFPCTMAFVAKFTPDGSSLVYSTYLGGSAENSALGIAVDSAGNAYLTGATNSSDFPETARISTAGSGAFVTKLSASGTALSYSVLLGGANGASGAGIAVNTLGNAFVVGNTRSSDFPTTAGALQAVFGGTAGGDGDAFVSKISVDGKSLVYSTYLGGSADESGRAIAIDADGNAYVAGTTQSTDFPVAQAFQGVCSANCSNTDVFVSKLDSAGAHLIFSTYLGGMGSEDAKGIAINSSREVYVAGNTQSFDFPTINAFEAGNPSSNGFPITFLAKFHADGASLAFSTYVQGLSFASLALDPSNNIYLSGFGGSAIHIVNPVQGVLTGCCMTLMKFNPTASTLIYSTYFGAGAPLSSHVTADSLGNAYVTGTALAGLPLTPAPFQSQFGGQGVIGGDVYLTKVSATDAPGVSFQPFQLNFLSQPLGTVSDPASITLFNTGSLPLTISNIVASGDFSLTPDSTCSTSVVGAGSCNVSVTFKPSATGTRIGSIVLTDNAATSPQTIALSGTAIATGPFDTASASYVDFGAQQVGVTSLAKLVTLTNTGVGALNITSIATLGGPFAETNNCPATMAAGSQCTISITFTPTDAGPVPPVGFNISVVSNAPDSPKKIALTGSGYLGNPGVSLDTTNLNFGSVLVGGFSSPQTSTLYNNTNAALSLSGVTLTGTAAKDFVLANYCANGTVPAGSFCGLQVAFRPSVSGNESATITITDSGAGSPRTISLLGVGVTPAPAVSLSTSTITFGNLPIGSSASPIGLMISNTGNAPLSFSSIQIGGTNAADFSLTNQCGSTLDVELVCAVQINFKPSAAGTRSATVTLVDNAPNSPQAVTLTGTGVTPAASVALAPTSLDFGTVLIGKPGPAKAVTLTNTGNASLGITSIAAVGVDYTETNNCGTSVASGASCTINVTFSPSASGTNPTRIDILDNASNSPQSIALSGTGTEFVLTPSAGSSTTQTVNAGQTAQYNLTLSPTASTRDTVSLSCSGAPATTSCSVSPSLQTFTGASPVPVSVSVSTALRGGIPSLPPGGFPPAETIRILISLLCLLGFLLAILRLRNFCRIAEAASAPRFFRLNVALLICLSIALGSSGCGGGTSSPPPPPPPTGTPAGIYNLSVTAKSASSTNPDQTVSLVLNVR